MKKLLILILIICLPLIAFFQYKNYRRFNPPSSYEYALNYQVDMNYHQPELVEEYFQKIVEVSAFARMQWSNERIDVRFPNIDSETETNAANYYNVMLTRLKWLEARLSRSTELKEAGFSNTNIKEIEAGVPPTLAGWGVKGDAIKAATLGQRGEVIWSIQKKLIEKGYNHTLDGVFGVDTQTALLQFQTDQDLFPSGRMNETTFRSLFIE